MPKRDADGEEVEYTPSGVVLELPTMEHPRPEERLLVNKRDATFHVATFIPSLKITEWFLRAVRELLDYKKVEVGSVSAPLRMRAGARVVRTVLIPRSVERFFMTEEGREAVHALAAELEAMTQDGRVRVANLEAHIYPGSYSDASEMEVEFLRDVMNPEFHEARNAVLATPEEKLVTEKQRETFENYKACKTHGLVYTKTPYVLTRAPDVQVECTACGNSHNKIHNI